MQKKIVIKCTHNSDKKRYELDSDVQNIDIDSFSDNGEGGTTVTLDNEHEMANEEGVTIANSSTSAYNGTYMVFNVDGEGKAFDIPVAYDDDPEDGDASYNRHTFNQYIISHLLGGAIGYHINEEYKDDPYFHNLAELHNVEFEFNDD